MENVGLQDLTLSPSDPVTLRHVNRGGWLALEHGYDQAERCRELLSTAGLEEMFTRTDLAGVERVSGGRRPPAPVFSALTRPRASL